MIKIILSCSPTVLLAIAAKAQGFLSTTPCMFCTFTHTSKHINTLTCVLFTYPQLGVNKGEAEGKPASTLLTVSVSQLDSSALNSVSFLLFSVSVFMT